LEWSASPQEDLPREIGEEMGLEVKKVADNPCYFVTGQQTMNPNAKIANVIYETTLASLDFRASDECLEIKFVDKQDFKDMPVFPDIKKLAEMFKPENHEREHLI
jgi:ADP-ribose pyrophosphatase YjhB (NUDIX family)